jgi:predicted negative regulator of RcsB-dependent stress response
VDLLSEGEQWEALKAWLRRNAPPLIGGLAVGALGYFGWQWWEGQKDKNLQDASARYETLLQTYERGDLTGGNSQLEELKRSHAGSIYVAAGELAAAKVYVLRNEFDNAIAALKSVAAGKEREFARIARVRLARLQVEQAKYDEALATLAADEPGAYAGQYAHVRGDALLRKGDTAGALREYQLAREELVKNSGESGAAELTALLDLKIRDLQETK